MHTYIDKYTNTYLTKIELKKKEKPPTIHPNLYPTLPFSLGS